MVKNLLTTYQRVTWLVKTTDKIESVSAKKAAKMMMLILK